MLSQLIEAVLTAFVVGLAVCAVIRPVRRRLLFVLSLPVRKFYVATTTAIERELDLVAEPQRIIERAQTSLQDLRGQMLHERDVLLLRQDEVSEAVGVYYKAVDDRLDEPAVNDLAAIVAEKEQEVSMQEGVLTDHKTAVASAYSAVTSAQAQLRAIKMRVRTDEGKAKATEALDCAARVIAEAQSINASGGALDRESQTVRTEFEQAKARVEDAGGSPEERALKTAKNAQEIAAIRQRLDAARRGAQPADAAARSAVSLQK